MQLFWCINLFCLHAFAMAGARTDQYMERQNILRGQLLQAKSEGDVAKIANLEAQCNSLQEQELAAMRAEHAATNAKFERERQEREERRAEAEARHNAATLALSQKRLMNMQIGLALLRNGR
eukprot:TRINITY_DN103954_c0_g1_i1.p1 TRINITY_DN103954_c0_g1~~TRINITY_DN103954_c0_g1_i1.p1  ORF type:complete len:122 (+),score=32.10 TRINITY_DN103954_c0_g1_i1:148-513(+)